VKKLTKAQVKEIAIKMLLTAIEIGVPTFISTLVIAKITSVDDLKVALIQAASVAGSMVLTALIHVGKNLIKAYFDDWNISEEELQKAFENVGESGGNDE
jgi:hypothetical protein